MLGKSFREIMKKMCWKCKGVKELYEFYRSKTRLGGRDNKCKLCSNKIQKEWCDKNPDKIKTLRRKYEKTNRDPLKEIANRKLQKAKRRVIIKNTDIDGEFLKRLKDEIGDNCPYCKDKTDIWHLDHMIPLCKNGEHMAYNVVYCCADCNLKKGKSSLKEFLNKT